jgi:hypothetical protein
MGNSMKPILVVTMLFLFLQATAVKGQLDDKHLKRIEVLVDTLKHRLGLNEGQVKKIRDIYIKIGIDFEKSRDELEKNDPEKLKIVALKARDSRDKKIMNCLNKKQNIVFRKMLKERAELNKKALEKQNEMQKTRKY